MGQDLPGLPEALRLLRERVGLSQAALAQGSGASQSQIYGYEKGASTPGTGTLARILSAMSADFADLEQALREVRGEPAPTNGNPAPLLDGARSASSEMKARHQAIEDEVDRRVARIVRYMLGLDSVAPAEVEEILEEVAQ